MELECPEGKVGVRIFAGDIETAQTHVTFCAHAATCAYTQELHAAKDQIASLANFLLSLDDCPYPRCDAAHPAGMGATEAAIEYITWLRRKLSKGV